MNDAMKLILSIMVLTLFVTIEVTAFGAHITPRMFSCPIEKTHTDGKRMICDLKDGWHAWTEKGEGPVVEMGKNKIPKLADYSIEACDQHCPHGCYDGKPPYGPRKDDKRK